MDLCRHYEVFDRRDVKGSGYCMTSWPVRYNNRSALHQTVAAYRPRQWRILCQCHCCVIVSSSNELRAGVRRRGDVVDVPTICSMVSLWVGAASTLRRLEEPLSCLFSGLVPSSAENDENQHRPHVVWWLTVGWKYSPSNDPSVLPLSKYHKELKTAGAGALVRCRWSYCPWVGRHGWWPFLSGALLAWVLGGKVKAVQASEIFGKGNN